METSLSNGEVSLLPVSGTGWEVKIGATQAGFAEKLRLGIANWLDNPCGGAKSRKRPTPVLGMKIKWEMSIQTTWHLMQLWFGLCNWRIRF